VKAPEEEIGAEEEEERHEVLGYVVRQLNDQLFNELMEGSHAWGAGEWEVESESSDEEEEEGDDEYGHDEYSGSEDESDEESEDESDGEWEGGGSA
jgi:hypothetical protein